MAIVKHIKSRNANYSAAINYLLFEHDEKTGKTLGVPVELFTVPVLSEPREYKVAEYWRYEFGAELD